MCLNKILKEEQIALMRYSAEADQFESNTQIKRLDKIRIELELYPYTHRPYLPQGLKMARRMPRRKSLSPPVAAWENEGGAI